ncbi:MAG: DNA-protecting protein DprA [Candidatus Portnoybacteria bacterium]|nr:DNA-protecting protein DprA [Candidatus Portnoybacteria bacterium]
MNNQMVITLRDKRYPQQLKKIKNPSKALYVKGDSEVLSEPCFSIVGTRKASGEGLELARQIACELAKAGLVIVSGLAQGIDGEAHRGALEAGGRTVGVIGSSLEERFFFPLQHVRLAREMIEKGGVVISEYEKNQPALRRNFVARNRIIAGLSIGVLVVQAPIKSGALITAQFSKEQGRLIFAVPGSPFSKHFEGTNHLIKTGAFLVERAKDILEILQEKKLFLPRMQKGITANSVRVYEGIDDKGARILEALESGQTHIDSLAKKTKVEVAALLGILTELEMKGIIKSTGGGKYILLRSTN